MLKELNVLIRTCLLIGSLAIAAHGQNSNYVVQLSATADTDAAGVAARHGMTLVKSLTGSATGIHVLAAPAGQDPGLTVQSLTSDPAVQTAEADGPVAVPGINAAAQIHPPSAPAPMLPIDGTLTQYYTGMAANGYVNQPAASVINIAGALQAAVGNGTTLGPGATVAVLDTGVDFAQPVLMNSVISGYDFVNSVAGGQEVTDINQETTPILDQETTPILDQETTPILDGGTAIVLAQETTPILDQETTPILDATQYPAYGHGTMVAGLIHLVAPNALIMPVRVFAADGTATISQVIQGIYWAVDNGAQVINMSFSTPVSSTALRDAIDYADDNDVICVASAGNDGQPETVFPAGYHTVIDVASISNQGIRSLFSNYGSPVDLAAPGEAVVTTYPGNHYAIAWGTSFSAPLVAGGAALLVSVNGGVGQEGQIRNALMHAANIGYQQLGAGELNLVRAINNLSQHDD
jgi:subtilisin family serine protease